MQPPPIRVNTTSENSAQDPTWTDITAAFRSSASAVPAGQLVMASHFSLTEAMSALEVGDPKMDAGAAAADSTDVSIDQSNGWDNLEEGDLVVIVDELMARLMTWLDGGLLVQTLFACIPIQNLEYVRNPVLKTILLAVLRLTSVIKNIVIKAYTFDDDDFHSESHTFSFYDSEPTVSILSQLVYLSTVLSSETLKRRLELLRALIMLFSNITDLEALSRELNVASTLLKTVDPSTSNVPNGVFDPNNNRRLFLTCPPRPIAIKSRSEAYISLRQHTDSISSALILYSATATMNSLLDKLKMPMDSILSRSLLQLLLFPDPEWTQTRRYCCAKEAPYIPRVSHLFNETLEHQITRYISSYSIGDDLDKLTMNDRNQECVYQLSVVICWVLRARGYSPARQRRILAKIVHRLDDLHHMYSVATYPPDSSIIQCLEALKMEIAVDAFLMGFGLELYSSHETAIVLWQVEYLLETLASLSPSSSSSTTIEAQRVFIRGLLYFALILPAKTPHTSSYFDPDRNYEHRFRLLKSLRSPVWRSFGEFQRLSLKRCDEGVIEKVHEFQVKAIAELKNAMSLMNTQSPGQEACTKNLQTIQDVDMGRLESYWIGNIEKFKITWLYNNGWPTVNIDWE